MYERFRNDFLLELASLNVDNATQILQALDKVFPKYDIKLKETGLSVLVDELPELVKMYLVCKKIQGLSDTTITNYKIFLQLFFRYVNKQPQTVTTNDIRIFLYKYQKDKEISFRTLDKYREYIARFFTWAHENGYIEMNPARNVAPIKYEEKPRESLTQLELEYLRTSCQSIKEKAIIEFLYSTGCRVSELANVKKADINWSEKTVHLFGKGKKHRTSFINAKAEVTLLKYLNDRNDDCEYLFVSSRKPYHQMHKEGIEKIVRNISKRASNLTGKHITPHVLRHTTATTALRSGMPITDISKLLGHENIETTMIYAKSSIEDVRAGHKKYIM